MTPQELAARLDGREIGREITPEEEKLAAENGLVVVFGASDDLAEIRGAVLDEVDCYEGGIFHIDPRGVRDDWTDGEERDKDEARKFFQREGMPAVCVNATWCDPDKPGKPSWSYKVHAGRAGFGEFRVYEDGELYCVGIVFKQPR